MKNFLKKGWKNFSNLKWASLIVVALATIPVAVLVNASISASFMWQIIFGASAVIMISLIAKSIINHNDKQTVIAMTGIWGVCFSFLPIVAWCLTLGPSAVIASNHAVFVLAWFSLIMLMLNIIGLAEDGLKTTTSKIVYPITIAFTGGLCTGMFCEVGLIFCQSPALRIISSIAGTVSVFAIIAFIGFGAYTLFKLYKKHHGAQSLYSLGLAILATSLLIIIVPSAINTFLGAEIGISILIGKFGLCIGALLILGVASLQLVGWVYTKIFGTK